MKWNGGLGDWVIGIALVVLFLWLVFLLFWGVVG